jgi:hypothetical protein
MSDVRTSFVKGRKTKHEKRRERVDSQSSGPILKFSGLVPGGPGTVTSFLMDGGTNTPASSTPPRYPLPMRFEAGSLTCNLLDGAAPPAGGSFVCQLVKNGVAVPRFSVAYSAGQTGVSRMFTNKPVVFAPGDTLGLAVIATGFTTPVGSVSAMLSTGLRLGCLDLCAACAQAGGFCKQTNSTCTCTLRPRV